MKSTISTAPKTRKDFDKQLEEAPVIAALKKTLAGEYSLLVKTQNFHWNVEGPMFFSLHKLFEEQYKELAEFVDRTAEVIRAHNVKAPGSFPEFQRLSDIEAATSDYTSAQKMIEILDKDHLTLSANIKEAMLIAEEENDSNTVTLYEDLVSFHEKAAWMIRSHRGS